MAESEVLHAVVLAVVGAAVAVVGRWGRANAIALVPDHFEVYDRERRIRSLRRGGFACLAAGIVMMAAAVLTVT